MARFNRRRVRRYVACPECESWSIRVEENGRICRHSIGFGYVERFPPGHPFKATPICKGSGRKVLDATTAPPGRDGWGDATGRIQAMPKKTRSHGGARVNAGRPPRSSSPAEHRIAVRLTDEEWTRAVASLRNGESLSGLTRTLLLREADRRLKR